MNTSHIPEVRSALLYNKIETFILLLEIRFQGRTLQSQPYLIVVVLLEWVKVLSDCIREQDRILG